MPRARGQFGPIAHALLQQVEQRPGTVRDVAARAQVGYAAAAYTITRLCDAGLCVLDGGRPAVVKRADAPAKPDDPVAVALTELSALWRSSPSSQQGAQM